MSIPRSEPVYRITAAQTPLSEDIRGRTRRYLYSMGLRTLCFIGATIASGPLRWVLIVGACVLPYLAVVFANAGRAAADAAPPIVVHRPNRSALGPGTEPTGDVPPGP